MGRKDFRRAWCQVSNALAATRRADKAFSRLPARNADRMAFVLPDPEDLRLLITRSLRPLNGSLARSLDLRLQSVQENYEFAMAALDSRAWDAAIVDIDPIVEALEAVDRAFRLESRTRLGPTLLERWFEAVCKSNEAARESRRLIEATQENVLNRVDTTNPDPEHA